MFWAIFDRKDMKTSLYGVVFRVEFDGDVRFCVALQAKKNTFYKWLSIFIEIFVIFMIFVFRRFFGRQASYGAETLTSDRSRAPGRSEKTLHAFRVDEISRSRSRPTSAGSGC